MATSQKLTDQFLTCTVCMEVFSDPCTLECQHTFCRKCVTNFTKSQPDAISARSFLCPFCRRLMKIPDPEKPVEEWAKQVKPSFLIQGLMESFGPGTKDTIYCSYCKEEGETTLATVWCSVCDDSLCDRCLRVHKRIPSSKHHEVAKLSEEVKVRKKRKVICKEHETESVRFLCKDCKKAVCQTCCIIYHRKCDSVVTIESELGSMKTALVKGKDVLLKKHHASKKETEKRKLHADEVAKMCSEIEKEIKSLSQDARDTITRKERKLLSELKHVSCTQIGHLKADIKRGEMATQMYRQQSELIDQAVKSDWVFDIYDMYRSFECGAARSGSMRDRDRERKGKGGLLKIKLRKDTDKFTKTLTELQLGEIDVMYDDRVDLKASPVLQDTIVVRVPSDKRQSYPTDVKVMVVNGTDTVVVTDGYNACVKSFYKRNNQSCHSKLTLDSNPWSLTQIKHNQVAVTVQDTRQIVTIEVSPDLRLLSTLTTQKQYWGITSHILSRVAVGCKEPPTVDILDMAGNIIKSVDLHNMYVTILKYPNFLFTTKMGNILVSDSGTHSVLCLTPQGYVVFNYFSAKDKLLKGPRGMTVTNTGDILLTDYSLNSVLHLNESGQFVRNILTPQDGLSGPYGITLDRYGRLYICLRYKGVIRVFSCTS